MPAPSICSGPGTSPQKSPAATPPAAERRWIDNRERRQRALVTLAEQVRQPSLSVDAAAALMNRHFASLAEPADPAGREASAALMAQLLNAATPDQKAHLMKKLRGYASDLTVLASEGAPG